MKTEISPQVYGAKVILETLSIGELRLIEDYAMHLRVDLQNEQLRVLKS